MAWWEWCSVIEYLFRICEGGPEFDPKQWTNYKQIIMKQSLPPKKKVISQTPNNRAVRSMVEVNCYILGISIFINSTYTMFLSTISGKIVF